MSSRTKTIVSGLSWTLVDDLVKMVVGFVSVPLSLNYFGKETYGLIAMANSINVYLSLLDLGMANTNVRFFSEYIANGDKEREQRLLRFTNLFYLVIGIINSIVLFVCAFFVQYFFKITPEQVYPLRNLVLILAFNSTFSWVSACMNQFLTAHELIDWLKIRSIFLRLFAFGALLLTISLKWRIEVYFFISIFSITMILPLSVYKAKKVSPGLIIKPRFDKEMCRTVLPYALTVFSFSIFYFLAYNSRSILLGNMCGPGTIAEFSIIITILSVVSLVTSGFTTVLLPVVTKMRVNKEQNSLLRVSFSGTKILNILLSLVVFALVLETNEVIAVYVGEEYNYICKWLIFALLTLLLMHRNVMTALVYTEKKLKVVSFMGFIAMCVAFALYFVFIPMYGLGGVFIGWLGHELVHTLFYYLYFIPKKLNINALRVFVKAVLPTWLFYALTCVCVSYLLNLFSLTIWPSAILKGLLFVSVVAPVTWFGLLNKDEKGVLMGIIKKNKANE